MSAKNLVAWDVRAEGFPGSGSMYDKLKFLLRYAILAPSGPNTQPWKLAIDGGDVLLMADLTRSLPDVEPSNRTLYMSLGCLLTNLLVAAEHFGFGYDVSCFPQGNGSETVASVSFQEGSGSKHNYDPSLFAQITERHTNRGRYEDRPIEPEKLDRMKRLVEAEGLRLDIFTDEEGKGRMADLLGRAHRIQLGNKAFRKDLASWIRANNEDAWDGLPGYSFGYSDFESYFGKFIFGKFDTSGSRARKETGLMRESPTVAILSSESDDLPTLVRAGMTFEKLFLAATAMDVRFDLFSQPIGIDELRREMAGILNVSHPQLLIRMGYAPPARHTPRRLVETVLVQKP